MDGFTIINLEGGMPKARLKRPRKRSTAVDYYLHAILVLTEHGQPADTGDLAAKVGVSAAAASQMLKKLSKQDLVQVQPYRGAELTTQGLHRALRVIRRHRLLEDFLHRVMGFEIPEIHVRALALQPAIDEAFEEKMDAMLGHPTIDPHGQPIPAKDATWPKLGDSPLLDLPPGTSGQVSRVTTDSNDAIKYLQGLGIVSGVTLVLDSVSPFDGPVAVRVNRNVLHLGRRLAQAIHVSEQGKKGQPPSANLVHAGTKGRDLD